MEFNFDINHYFKNEITKIGSRLIPDGFMGDRREVQECITRMSFILTVLGENSAKAQGLQKVITSGERLRNTDHAVYVLIEPKGGSKGSGAVLGMLKMGVKHLYVFDASGNNHEVSAKCVLDFYVHESKQRMGLGRKLFQHMLKEEDIEPQHLAIDKPSPKFLSFLHKHYSLETIIPQMNNFVVFDGFFTNRQSGGKSDGKERMYAAGVSSSTSRFTASGAFAGFNNAGSPAKTQPPAQPQSQPTSTHNVTQNSHYGRPAPHKPVSTMGMILQHKPSAAQPSQPGSTTEEKQLHDQSVIPNNEKSNDLPEAEDNLKEKPDESEDSKSLPEPEMEDEIEIEEKLEASVAQITEAVAVEPPGTPLNRNGIQAATAPHLDLKFYHSSLW